MRRSLARAVVSAAIALVGCGTAALVTAPAASAHPLGNFTVSYASALHVEPDAVRVDVVVDRAEIPTLQAFPDAAPGRQPVGADAWRTEQCAQLATGARLSVGGQSVPLAVSSSRLEVVAGAAGLATTRLECALRSAEVQTVGRALSYAAPPTGARVGWHEVTAVGDGTRLATSDVPATSVSQQLRAYPADLLTSPLDQRSARLQVERGDGAVAGDRSSSPLAAGPLRGLDRFTTAYTDLVSRTHLTPAFALLAIVLSLVLGAAHAFAPGHGKTLMAAYLVSREGTWRQAATIGVSVTITHTLGVLLLGAALSGAALAAPERVYPWLGLVSGLLLAGIGVTLLRAARRGHTHGPGGHTHGPGGHTHEPVAVARTLVAVGGSPAAPAHSHDHAHDHAHDHSHDHSHSHDHAHAAPRPAVRGRRGTLRLAAVGLAGGLVPSPSALLVLLGGIALGRAWFGAVLVLFYGIGMASALVGTGLLLVLARDRFERWSAGRAGRSALPGQHAAMMLARALPVLTAVAVTGLGLLVVARSALTV
ncbi:hypothetical protein GCM10027446_01000 [Angustibacter peucedani]